METKMRPGDRVPMSWDEYEQIGEYSGEIGGTQVEHIRCGPGTSVTLEVGPTEVAFDPVALLE